jgi:hypothetical protein
MATATATRDKVAAVAATTHYEVVATITSTSWSSVAWSVMANLVHIDIHVDVYTASLRLV